MLRRFYERHLCRIGKHDWSLFRKHGNMFRSHCQRDCGAIRKLSEIELNYRRLAYDATMKHLGKNYDNPYLWIGEENGKKVNG